MALAALGLGVVQLFAAKGTRAHRLTGYVWAALMVGTAVTASFIYDMKVWGNFSPIHLLIPITLFTLWRGINAARRGNIRYHRISMLALFFMALVVTGLFTLLPGRAMHQVFFGAGG